MKYIDQWKNKKIFSFVKKKNRYYTKVLLLEIQINLLLLCRQ